MVIPKAWVLVALTALATFSTARSVCDDLEQYFGDVSSVSEINLNVDRIECPENEDGELIEGILIESGKALTITTTEDYVRFVNVRFTVEDGASLKFDMDLTRFGPNSGDSENAQGFVLDVKEGGSVIFKGESRVSQVRNVRSVFYNAGTIEFKGQALFNNNGNVFRSNSGTLKFRSETTFRNNIYQAIDNIDSGYVRFSKKATFDDNGRNFDGGDGGAIHNEDETSTVIFRDDVIFENHSSEGPGAVGNSGKMRFYGKAYFTDNRSYRGRGGGANNHEGTMIFKDAVEFNGNEAEYGGGLAVEGGKVTFQDSVTFYGNWATTTGGAFSVTFGGEFGNKLDAPGYLKFKKPEEVVTRGNFIDLDTDDEVPACTLAYVEEGTTLIGFDREDVCVEA